MKGVRPFHTLKKQDNRAVKYNKDFVFLFQNRQFVAVDVYNKRLFELEPDLVSNLAANTLSPEQERDLESAGFFTPSDDAWEGDFLSWIAHRSSRVLASNTPTQNRQAVLEGYLAFSAEKEELPPRVVLYQDITCLPEPNQDALEQASFWAALKQRKTSRNFKKQTLPLETLSTILYASCGLIHGKKWKEFEENGLVSFGERKSSPSATGLQTLDALVAVSNVQDLPNGIYQYLPEQHALGLISAGFGDETLIEMVCDQFWVENIPCGIVLVADMRRTWAKDKDAIGYTLSYMEGGHIAQTIQLCSSALGLKTWVSGAFRHDLVQKVLGLKEEYLVPQMYVGFGTGDDSAIPALILETLQKKS